jgi:hypothetical protein
MVVAYLRILNGRNVKNDGCVKCFGLLFLCALM